MNATRSPTPPVTSLPAHLAFRLPDPQQRAGPQLPLRIGDRGEVLAYQLRIAAMRQHRVVVVVVETEHIPLAINEPAVWSTEIGEGLFAADILDMGRSRRDERLNLFR
ncbi:MAG TPA: hypothetical protein VFG12_02635 [Rhodopila sp.]|nr:hypothetical protein [Rhodopila sp.]